MNVPAVVLKFIINGGRCLKTSFNGIFHHVSVSTPQTFKENASRFHFPPAYGFVYYVSVYCLLILYIYLGILCRILLENMFVDSF